MNKIQQICLSFRASHEFWRDGLQYTTVWWDFTVIVGAQQSFTEERKSSVWSVSKSTPLKVHNRKCKTAPSTQKLAKNVKTKSKKMWTSISDVTDRWHDFWLYKIILSLYQIWVKKCFSVSVAICLRIFILVQHSLSITGQIWVSSYNYKISFGAF